MSALDMGAFFVIIIASVLKRCGFVQEQKGSCKHEQTILVIHKTPVQDREHM